MSEPMIIYVAGAIRGKVFMEDYFQKTIDIVKEYGKPVTEKVGYNLLPITQYIGNKQENIEKRVAERDRKWLRLCRAAIVEFSGASTGTGWEICYATRVYRKPTLCLYHKSMQNNVSLMIKQDNSKYTINQMYSNHYEFENYIRIFLETLIKSNNIDEIRRVYIQIRDRISSNSAFQSVKTLIHSLLNNPYAFSTIQGKLQVDIDHTYVLKPKKAEIDFKDSEQFIQFLFKSIILQTKWDSLKSQRIGITYIGGRKPRIIKILSRLEYPIDLSTIYDTRKEEIGYTREAFTKNIRAFRKIGLLGTPKNIEIEDKQRGSKFKDKIIIFKTLYGNLELKSTRSSSEIMKNLIFVTQHLQHLHMFLNQFKSKQLINLLSIMKTKDWYKNFPEIDFQNIDQINLNMYLDKDWGKKIMKDLYVEIKSFWKNYFSSF